ncbi:MAG: hypothetical protein DWQ01_20955 [Planctomycetota bacterium]|nr:MAG: hypothetical protein DWQ01_20955 [Planctomycetota bacterium]
MARSLGIHLQADGFAYALVEGNAKRFQIKTAGSGGLDQASLDPVKGNMGRGLGKAIARAVKAGVKGKVDQVVFSLPSNQSVLRELSLPFSDRDKVQQVLKFEVESELYHLDIDDVICDFVELHDDRATSSLLVSAVPKSHVEETLRIADYAGYEPHTVESDLGALVNAVQAFRSEQPEEEGLQAYLYVGSVNSVLLVMAADGVRAARLLHLGWRELARGMKNGTADPEAGASEGPSQEEDGDRALMLAEDPETGEQAGGEVGEGDEDEEVDEEEDLHRHDPLFGTSPELPLGMTLEAVVEAADSAELGTLLRRMVNEVRRGLAAVAGAQVVKLNLMGAALPGLEEALATRLGVVAAPMSLSAEDEQETGVPADAVAVGAALQGVGAGISPMNFRQEEFRFTRGLERVEGPLTFMLLGVIGLLLIQAVILVQKSRVLKRDLEIMVQDTTGKVSQFNESLSEDEKQEWHIRTDWSQVDLPMRLNSLRIATNKKKTELDKLVGEAGVEMIPSCLRAWKLVHEVLQAEMSSYPDRWIVEYFDFMAMDKSRNEEAHVLSKFSLTLFGDDLQVGNAMDRLIQVLNGKEWVISAENRVLRDADVAGAKNGELEVRIMPAKAKEVGL